MNLRWRAIPVLATALTTFSYAAGAFAYTLEFPESGEGSAPECIFYPLNCRMYATDFIGVRAAVVRENPSNPGIYKSDAGAEWGGCKTGETDTVRLVVNGPATASFRNGKLTAFQRPDGEGDRERDLEILTQTLPAKAHRAFRKGARHERDGHLYWAKSRRLRLWYDNPNAAGSLAASLALAALSFALFSKKLLPTIAGLTLAAAFAALLYFTQSRGAMLALAGGTAILLPAGVSRLERPAQRRGALILLALAFAAAIPMTLHLRRRWIDSDGSTAKRLQIWKDAPRMIASAPDGWATAPGYVWCEWFQPLDDDFTTAWLVNSHLSWMVQHGRTFRRLYASAWIFAFAVLAACSLRGQKDARPAASSGLAQTVCLFTALWFSTVGCFPEMWIAPGAAVLFALWKSRPATKTLAFCLVFSLAAAAIAIYYIEKKGAEQLRAATAATRVEKTRLGVKIGNGVAKTAVIHDNIVLTARYHGVLGKDLRGFFLRHPDAPAAIVARSFKAVPEKIDTLVLAGGAADAYMEKCAVCKPGDIPFSPRRVYLLSPSKSWKAVPENLLASAHVEYTTGEFAARLSAPGGEAVPPWVEIVPGAALFVRGWTEKTMKD